MAASIERFNLFCGAVVTIVNSHEPTSQFYNHLREKMAEYLQKIESLTDEVALQQSGSSYDNLHMTRLLKTESGEQIFVPTTDFDFNVVLKKLLIAVDDADLDAGSCGTENRSSSAYFGVLHSSENPGYAKVQVSQHGRQYIKDKECDYLFEDIDSEGFISNISLKRRILENLPELTTSGPAFSNFLPVKQGYSYDFVYALPVNGWPAEAAEWISRDRPTAWPSEELVARIVADGCMVVPVGHYTSDQTAFEWRVSFNHSERLLATSLNHVQRHCYCLTKLLLKTSLPEGCILSSYHMKNVFFYMVESQTQLTWESQKPGYLLMELLKEIVRGLANHNIPNYFIRTNNMIRHRTKEKVQFTLKEVSKLVEYPFFALAALCQKLQMYKKQRNVSNPSTRSSKESVELVSCLELYTVLNQSLYMLGLDRMVNEAVLSSSCFSLICGMNAQMSEFPKYGKLFTATSVPDLLINSALQNVQAGKVHEALSLHKIMYDHSSKEDLAKFPQILTNLGCLHNCIACEMPQDSTERAKTLEEAEAYFEKALKINGPSHSLHFVYGNFLYSNKLSYSKAVSHFQAACEGRSDETEIFITVEIPDQEGVRSVTIDSATGSFYFLALCHHDMQDVYSQRKTLRIFAENAPTLPINKRSAALELCAFAHGIGGLSVKGDLLMEDSKKAEKAAKLLQKQQSVANMSKKAL